ncbi:ras association domain-containing protein 4-like isoform X3 [Rhopilema esculentum]|uniref:ras association domain-containing protein 4-like isoform X3 n=1 Tax=Rhopilema esculentum TaxID=499914 RepID=UPI0031D8114D
MMPTQSKDKAERTGSAAKLKKRKAAVQRSHTFNSSYENSVKKKPDSPKSNECKKTTATSSPCPEPKYTKAVYLLLEAKKLAREIEEKKKSGDLFKNRLRGRFFLSGGRGYTFSRPGTPCLAADGPGNKVSEAKGKALQDVCRRCEECGRSLSAGYYSEHQAQPYCNVPCYTMLFSSLKSKFAKESNRQGDFDDGLSTEQQRVRNSLIPKLRTYNTYYSGRPFQIFCREDEGNFIMEGTLKVYWGLKKPVELKANDFSYWRSFHPVDDDGSFSENHINLFWQFPQKPNHFRRKVGRKAENSFQAPTISSSQKQANNNEVFCYKGSQKKTEQTSFVPPYGVPTTLRVTSNMKTDDVVGMLLRKFQIVNKPSQYSLCTVYESGGVKRITADKSPLVQRLCLGPCEDVSKIFIMEKEGQRDVPHEIAQYINFAMSELEIFLEKFKEEEEREVEKLKERYNDYKENLGKRMKELQFASKVTRL